MIPNALFFHTLNDIGGVETMFYELAKKYAKTHEMIIYYVNGAYKQVERLRKYCRVERYVGQEVVCKHAFFNYSIQPFIDKVTAERYFCIIHANFDAMNLAPIKHKKITDMVAVSKYAADAYFNKFGVKCRVVPNPYTIDESVRSALFICAAQRMTREKGFEGIKAVVQRMDKEDIPYYLLIFTNDKQKKIESKNAIIMPERLDIQPFIYGCDIFLVLSDTEARCYSAVEKLGYGTGKLLCTPIQSFEEIGGDDTNSIILNFDLSNMDEVIDKVRELYLSNDRPKRFEPVEVVDNWDELLIEQESNYIPEDTEYWEVIATDIWLIKRVKDAQNGGRMWRPNEIFVVSKDYMEELINSPYGKLVIPKGPVKK